ncbi:dihydropteroate synthase [Piscirickettsia salmonis]|nr:dihydropteroate synthase [Piscirickettsia salmonis]RNC78880.1 dihydropteroate synthase [Piscirickettsiaceae bacterium NZ-RLO2]WGZ73087.1 dihydropteroate synthase [Piscirickettsia salmonis EM-90]QHS34123.1 dihydropteroate synthase [Piscirickettsia salmonis]QIX56874.1 dihydropteroate synthase [Piscirickettsia salmonis]QNR81919.1 dihydropteroate synthase [Piscirickettsia salmonis]
MGIINLTPESFYKPALGINSVLEQAEHMVDAGAEILDIGAIATNPSININQLINPNEELALVMEAITAIRAHLGHDIFLSIDSFNTSTILEVLKTNIDMINIQQGTISLDIADQLVISDVYTCIMHWPDPAFLNNGTNPDQSKNADSNSAYYQQRVAAIITDLTSISAKLIAAGMRSNKLIIDPGFGGGHYGKSDDENLYMLYHLPQFLAVKHPILVGLSRKGFLSRLLSEGDDSLQISVSSALIAAQNGAKILRVHDVKETADAIKVIHTLSKFRTNKL